MMTFSERMRRRMAVWWEDRSLGVRVHRFRERARQRRGGEPDEAWRCCEAWPRQLIAKQNGRVFAARHGLRVPTLHWRGRLPARIPWDALPDDVVVKSSTGSGARGTFVVAGGRELNSGTGMTRDELQRAVLETHGRVCRYPLLVEDFVLEAGAKPVLPVEYRCFTFGRTVAFIEVMHRVRHEDVLHACYSPDWQRHEEDFRTGFIMADPEPAPPHLAEMLAACHRLGPLLGTFMRLDFYMGRDGPVFGEFSSTPRRGLRFSDKGERVLGALWEEHFPERT